MNAAEVEKKYPKLVNAIVKHTGDLKRWQATYVILKARRGEIPEIWWVRSAFRGRHR